MHINKSRISKINELEVLRDLCKIKGHAALIPNFDRWKEIEDIITKWYIIKYPKNLINKLESNYYNNIEEDIKINELTVNMGYTELMVRINEELHSLIECWYIGKEKNKVIEGSFYDLTLSEDYSKKYFSIDKHDGFIKHLDRQFMDQWISINYPYIDTFIKIINKDNFDISEMEQLVESNKINKKIRKLYFELIVINLLNSDNDILVGYIRANKFIEEFNKFVYNLYLDYEQLTEFEDKINNCIEVTNYILSKLPDNNLDIENLGLTFHTIKRLKELNINKITDLNSNSIHYLLHGDGIVNYGDIPHKDKEILTKNTKNNDYDPIDKVVLEKSINSNNKIKKRSLFKKWW